MGQGGKVVIVNGTDSAWKRTDWGAYQMTFQAPDDIPANSTVSFYVEFYETFLSTWSDDSAHALYQVVGDDTKFVRVEAHWRYIQYKCIGFGEIKEDYQKIGFNHDGYVTVALVGGPSDGGYVCNVDTPDAAANWMAGSLSRIGALRLRDVCLPASHDAGMSLPINGSTFGVTAGNVITQSKNVAEQLGLGARYFDIRPVTHAGAFYCGHYSGKRGGNGQSIADVIAQVNAFTAAPGRNELVVLSLSHDSDTDGDYGGLGAAQWAALYKQLEGLTHRYEADSTVELGSLPIASFIRFSSAVVVVCRADKTPVELLGKGFFDSASLAVYDEYADTNDLSTMMANQLQKMKTQTAPAAAPNRLFLLSWTLTQNTNDAVFFGSTIEQLATQADGALGQIAPDVVPGAAFPNLLMIDYFKDTTATALAIWCNRRASETMPKVLSLSSVGLSTPRFGCC